MANHCLATRADGSPCRATPTASGFCFAHDPELRKRTAAARQEGGRNRANITRASKHVPRSMQHLAQRLLAAVDEVHSGELDPKKATAMASLAGAAVRVYEVGELEVRIEELEARSRVAGLPGGGA